MRPLLEVRLVAARELRRNVRSTKGVALGVLTMLGALAASFVSVGIEGLARHQVAASGQAYLAFKRQMLTEATADARLADYLAPAPSSLLLFLQITVWLSPFLVALLGFDCVSGELQHRSIRFYAGRVRRSSFVLGKLAGLWALAAAVLLVVNAVAGGVALSRGYLSPGELASWGARFWLVAALIAGAWASIVVLVSSCIRTPIVALQATFAVYFALWLLGAGPTVTRSPGALVLGFARRAPWYQYLDPNACRPWLLSPSPARVAAAVAILAALVAVTSAASCRLFERRDV